MLGGSRESRHLQLVLVPGIGATQNHNDRSIHVSSDRPSAEPSLADTVKHFRG